MLSGEYPLAIKFPQIYRIDNHKTDIIGGYTELYKYLKPIMTIKVYKRLLNA